jgi:hypothetical protein
MSRLRFFVTIAGIAASLAIAGCTVEAPAKKMYDISNSKWEVADSTLTLTFSTTYASDGTTVSSLNFTLANDLPYNYAFDLNTGDAATIPAKGTLTGTYAFSATQNVSDKTEYDGTLTLKYGGDSGTVVTYYVMVRPNSAGGENLIITLYDTTTITFSSTS